MGAQSAPCSAASARCSTRSRRARLAPSWTGLSTSLKPRCTEPTAPPSPPNDAVSRIREQATSSPRTTRRRLTVLESYMFSAAAGAIPVRLVGAVDDLELLQGAPGADRDAG